MDIRIKCPFVMEVCGPSQSGKSSWVGKLIKFQKDLLEIPFEDVYWHSPHGHLPNELNGITHPKIHAIIGLPWNNQANHNSQLKDGEEILDSNEEEMLEEEEEEE